MAMVETWYAQDLNQPVQVHYLHGNVFSQDSLGNLVGVHVFDNNLPASLSGTVSGNVIRSDGGTVAVAGTLSENDCYIILPAAAYAVPGPISIIIKLTGGGSVTTLCAVVAYVYESSTSTPVDPGTILPSIQDLLDAIAAAVATIPADYSTVVRAASGFDGCIPDLVNITESFAFQLSSPPRRAQGALQRPTWVPPNLHPSPMPLLQIPGSRSHWLEGICLLGSCAHREGPQVLLSPEYQSGWQVASQ